MKIAVLGWGSLIWDKGDLQIRSQWFQDGPLLPIEFARLSKFRANSTRHGRPTFRANSTRHRRPTLVITHGSPRVRTLWSLSALDSLEKAVKNLAKRETDDEEKTRDIGIWIRDVQKGGIDPEICYWSSHLNLDAVIWTNLSPKIDDEAKIPPVDELIKRLHALPEDLKKIAEEYIRRAPRQIDTPYRRRFEQEFKWTPLGDL